MTQQREAREAFLDALVYDDPVLLYERAPCGFLSTTPDGLIVKANATFRTWIGLEADDLVGRSFVDLLTPGGRIYHETHYAPSLQMHDSVREIALDLVRGDGRRLPVLVNATLDRDGEGRPRAIRIAVFDATERRGYERELLRAKEVAEASEERARELARTLQQTLMPPTPPSIPLLDVATAYHPAGEGVEVGGDFYDVFLDRPRRLGRGHRRRLRQGGGRGRGDRPRAPHPQRRSRSPTTSPGHAGGPQRGAPPARDRTVLHGGPHAAAPRRRRVVRRPERRRAPVAPAAARRRCPPAVRRHQPLIGVIEGATFIESTQRLLPGDVLVLYTDGVPDGRRDSEVYGDSGCWPRCGRTAPTRRRSSRGWPRTSSTSSAGCRATTSRCWPSASPPADRRTSGPRASGELAEDRGNLRRQLAGEVPDDAHGAREAFPAPGVEVAAPDGRLGGLGAAGEQPADDAGLRTSPDPDTPRPGPPPSITQQRPSGVTTCLLVPPTSTTTCERSATSEAAPNGSLSTSSGRGPR